MAASTPYHNFTEKDFISDPYFQSWVFFPDEKNSAFWQQFLSTVPSQTTAVENAARFLQSFRFTEHVPAEESISRLFAEHLVRVTEPIPQPKTPVRRLLARTLAAAALVAAVVVYLLFVKAPASRELAIATPYGQKKTLVLPDSSQVVLNANSQLKYSPVWKGRKLREVWLRGEAFFNIRHFNTNPQNIRSGDHFVVHAGRITVEVLGTQFDIRQRRNRTEIALQKGSIRITIQGNRRTQFIMQPGELVSYSEPGDQLERTQTNTKDYTSWKENKLLLVNPKLEEITRYLEDNFGKKIIIAEPGLSGRKIAGPILVNNLDDALFIISTVLKTPVEKRDSVIIIGARQD